LSLDPAFLCLAAIVFLAFATQALSGFGALALAVPLGAQLYGIEELKVLLVPTSIVATGAIVLRNPAQVDRALLLRAILPLMAAGALLGMALASRLSGPVPELSFALLVTLFAARELRDLLGEEATIDAGASSDKMRAPPAPRPSRVLISLAGVIHGLYATGGPLLVYTLGRAGLDKGRFRTTLAAVWLALNAGMTLSYAAAGRIDAAVLTKVLVLAPVTFAAGLAGAWAHDRVPERAFRRLVMALLLVSGLAMVVRCAVPLVRGNGKVAASATSAFDATHSRS